MGTNIIFGEISFITQAVGAVLQMAVSMDYAIFLLHRYHHYQEEGFSTEDAMRKAMTKAFSSITASCATTVLGFLALVFMRFKIGPDLGIVLAKGVLFSLISVIFFLPAVILASNRLIEKTSHRSLLPSFAWLGRFARAIRVPILILALIVTIPLFMAQRSNNFLYGMDQYEQGSREERDRAMITEAFGEQAQMVLLVPKGDREKEAALAQRLRDIPEVTSVISYSSMVGVSIPPDMLAPEQRDPVLFR